MRAISEELHGLVPELPTVLCPVRVSETDWIQSPPFKYSLVSRVNRSEETRRRGNVASAFVVLLVSEQTKTQNPLDCYEKPKPTS